MDDFHGAAAQHVGRAHHQRVAHFLRRGQGLLLRAGGGVGRLAQVQLLHQLLEALAVFGQVDRIRAGADDRRPRLFQRLRQLQRRLAAELHDHALGLFEVDDFHHVLEGQRLEIQAIRGVVIGRHGLRIAVDHDGFVTILAQRHRRVDAAVVELDALADAVRPAAQHDDLVALCGLRLALLVVAGVEVGGGGREFGGAGIDALVHRADAQLVAARAHRAFLDLEQCRQAAVGEAQLLVTAQVGLAQGADLLLADLGFGGDQLLDLLEEPPVDLRGAVHLFQAHAGAEGVADEPQALGPRDRQFLADAGQAGLGVDAVFGRDLRLETIRTGFQAAHGFLQRLLEVAADGHHLAHRLHLGGQARIGLREFLEGEARNLGDDVVDGRLERGRGDTAGDLVAQLVQGVAHRQLGGDLGDGEAGGLGGQRRGARYARVHLDHDHAPVVRVDRELHVGAAGIHSDLAQHRNGCVAHDLVFLVRQRLRRGHGDGVAGMHAHRIEVLDRADDDAVVLAVAHHLHLELFPAEQGLLDQHLGGRRQVEAAVDDLLELLDVVGHAAAGAAHGEAGADDHRIADLRLDGAPFLDAVGHAGTGRAEADLGHGVAELEAVLGQVDGVLAGADQLDLVLLQHAVVRQVQRAVQRGLAAHGGQHRVRALLLDDARHCLPADRLDVGGIGHLRVGHDGGRVGVDQDHPVAFLAQRLAGLRAGVVELAGLADDDRPSADDQDAF